jgi:hypothetical protein
VKPERAINDMFVVAVYIMDGMLIPVSTFKDKSDQLAQLGSLCSEIEEKVEQCRGLFHQAFVQLDQRLYPSSDVEDLVLRIVAVLRDVALLASRHPDAKSQEGNADFRILNNFVFVGVKNILDGLQLVLGSSGSPAGVGSTNGSQGIRSDGEDPIILSSHRKCPIAHL